MDKAKVTKGWETTVKEFDFQNGGRNHYCMKCIDKNQSDLVLG